MSMMMSQIYQFEDFAKTQNSKYLKNETFFLQIKKIIGYMSRTDLWEKYFCSRGNFQWIMVILSKACKPDNFELHSSLNLTFANIRDLCSNFVNCESFMKIPDILALCETNLDESIDYVNFSVRVYFLLFQKDSSTHMYGLAVYVKEGLRFAWDLSLENTAVSCLWFRLAILLFHLTYRLVQKSILFCFSSQCCVLQFFPYFTGGVDSRPVRFS